MGMFDSVYATCPNCGESVEFQSKADECRLGSYDPSSVPIAIAADLDGQSRVCKCGTYVTLKLPYAINNSIPMMVVVN